MIIDKKDNQYYAKYFEQAIDSIVNRQEIVNQTSKQFTKSEIEEMNSDAYIFVNTIMPQKSVHIGDSTSKTNGDLILDDKITEVKYVSFGKGTYFNTSVSYFEKIGLPSFKEHLKKIGYLDFLYNLFPNMVNINNSSPVSQENSSLIRKQYTEIYKKEILPREKEARKEYVKELYQAIKNDRNLQIKIAQDMISKEVSNKKSPDRLIIFNHETKNITVVEKNEINNYSTSESFKKLKDYTFGFDKFNITIAWQNGTGLNNPTIRVFLK